MAKPSLLEAGSTRLTRPWRYPGLSGALGFLLRDLYGFLLKGARRALIRDLEGLGFRVPRDSNIP